MRNRRSAYRFACALAAALLTSTPLMARAADLYVPAGGDLQAAIDAANPGDTILLEPGATYVGNFTLRVHGGSDYVTIRSAAPDELLPPAGTRITPAYAPQLPKIKSPNTVAAMRTAPSASYWRLLFLEFEANVKGYSDILQLGDGSKAQNALSLVPHHLAVDRVYMHGDLLHGQKRGIALNAAHVTIANSWIVEMKAIGQDSQAIAGWNGPGPFRIENNHLEGAGEVFLLGGDDPKIANMTPSDLVFTGNTLTRPLSWRDPIVATPGRVRASASLNGSLPAGTYAYRVTARRPASNTTAKSPASVEVSVTVAAGAAVTVEWDAVPDATDYVVYGRTPGAQSRYWVVTAPGFVDDGTSAGTSGTPSSKGTMWQVKNLFELKHVRGALVSRNVMTNNWAAAQQGTAVLITPRNQGGNCLWCVVEDVTFEYNAIRGTGSGLKILGWDDEHPSQQTNNITVRHNEFSDVSKAWGGTGYVFILIDGPRNVTIDHNTLIALNGGGVLTADQSQVEEFTFTNNVARHNNYGIQGGGRGFGSTAIAYYFPDGVIAQNVFAGGPASRYPAGNLFPSLATFEQHFVDYAGGDFALVPGTDWEGAGTDGLDLGADLSAIAQPGDTIPLRILTTTLPATTEGEGYTATLTAEGGMAPYTWTLLEGSLPLGLYLDPVSGTVTGVTASTGAFALTVQVEDMRGATSTQPLTVQVDRPIAPVSIVSFTVPTATATLPYAHALEATGGIGPYVWQIVGGALPAGMTISPEGVLAGTPTSAGTVLFTIGVFDGADQSRSATRELFLTTLPRPNQAPTVSVTAPAASAVLTAGDVVTLAVEALDTDGAIQRVDFYVDYTFAGSATTAPFTVQWQVPAAGTHTISAVAVDDAGASTGSDQVTVTASDRREVVIFAAQAVRVTGDVQLLADAEAAGGQRLWFPDRGVPKHPAAASPSTYAELTFDAEAGRPYQLWIRGRAERDSYGNDSVWVQFSNVPSAAIGTTAAMSVILEDGGGAGVSGWGWANNAWETGAPGEPIVFEQGGRQTVRILPREDGLSIDQIVLSAGPYFSAAPGLLKDDSTVLPATNLEVVLRASDVSQMAGAYELAPDETASGGVSLWNRNAGLAKVYTAAAAPASYAEFRFYAEAGRPYQLWVRARAERNSYANDSVHVQFDAVAGALIGTTSSLTMNLEDDATVGVSGWGWQDHGYGAGVLGAPITFATSGLQTIRIQPREDGLIVDQIVLSPDQFLTSAPGSLKDDTTIMTQ